VPLPGRVRALLHNSFLAAGSFALTAGALEMAARWAERRPAEPLAAAYTQFDPVLGWRHRAGARARSPQGDVQINSMGLRDRERTYRGAAGVRRVMVLGDSFAEGFSVKQEEAVSQVLERALDARGCAVEVLNAGTVGYSTDQELLFYQLEGSRYAPAVVALFLYNNDVIYNGRESVVSNPKPLFTFAGGAARLKNVPLPAAEPFRASGPAPPRLHGMAAARWVRARLAASAPGLYDLLARLRFWSPLPRGEPPLELQIYARRPPPEIDRSWEFTEHLLDALQRETARAGARLVVVYVPSKMEVSERDWEITRRRYRVDDTVWDRGRLASLLARAGRRIGFPVIDPTPELRAADHGWRGGPYHSGGGHWNALGHRVVAERLDRFLTSERWLPCP
jgi:hypothetical protein